MWLSTAISHFRFRYRHSSSAELQSMSSMAVLANGSSLKPKPPIPKSSIRRPTKHLSVFSVPNRLFLKENKLPSDLHVSRPCSFRIRSFQNEGSEGIGASRPDDSGKSLDNGDNGSGSSFLLKLAIALAIAATFTFISIKSRGNSGGSTFGLQFMPEGSSSSAMAASPAGFNFKAFGYRIVLPEYPPGWIYFWLLMAAGFGLFISEEALNIWVGISLARKLTLDGTWQSFAESFSKNAPYITSTVLWVYWGVCISDLVPFYLGKLFRQSGASDDVCSKLGIGKDKAKRITDSIQRYGNLAGLVERLSIGVRNPTGFFAGAMGVSPECFFAGVCCGCFITLPIQLSIGFLLRERPVFAIATVATVVGIWTVFPYAVAAFTALYLFLRNRYFS